MKRSMFAALSLAYVFSHAPLLSRDAAVSLPIPPSGVLGVGEAQLKKVARDVFAYVIHEGKVRAPAGAMELIARGEVTETGWLKKP